MPAVALGAGLLAVLRPAHPAEARRVHAVPDVVPLGQVARQPEPERLYAPGLPGRAGDAASRHVALPADAGDVGARLDGTGHLCVLEAELQGLHGLALPRGAGDAPRVGLPADAGDVGAVGEAHGLVGLVPERRVGGAGGRGALDYNNYF